MDARTLDDQQCCYAYLMQEQPVLCSNETIAQVLSRIDWQQPFVRRIAALLYQRLQHHGGWQLLNAVTQTQLLQARQAVLVQRMAIEQQLRQVNIWFEDALLPFVLLKGASLNANVYPLEAPRGAQDLDILVHPNDFVRAQAVLNSHMRVVPKPVKGVFDDAYEVSYAPRTGIGAHVDLHADLLLPSLSKQTPDALWDALDRLNPSASSAFTFTPAMQLLHLGLHALKNLDFTSYGQVDVYYLLKQNPITPDALRAHFVAPWQRRVLVLLLNTSLLRQSLPEWVVAVIAALPVSPWRLKTVTWLLQRARQRRSLFARKALGTVAIGLTLGNGWGIMKTVVAYAQGLLQRGRVYATY